MTIEGVEILAVSGATLGAVGAISTAILIPAGWAITAARRRGDRVQRRLDAIVRTQSEDRTVIAGIVAVHEQDQRRLERIEKKLDRVVEICGTLRPNTP